MRLGMIEEMQAMIEIHAGRIRRKKNNYIDNNNDNAVTAATVTAVMAGVAAAGLTQRLFIRLEGEAQVVHYTETR
jgi:hypothetical protein